MPIIKSAQKKMRQDERRRAQNLRVKRALKAASKKFESSPTFEALRQLQSEIDTAVKKRVLAKNTGSRQMKRYSAIAKKAGVKIAPTAKKPAAKSAAKTTAKKPAAKSTATKPATKKPTTTSPKQ
jgi:ribosomal protein S20